MMGPWIKLWRSFLTDPTVQFLKKRHGDVTVTLLVALLTSAEDGKVVTPEDEIAILCDISEEEYYKLVDIVIERGIIYRDEDGQIMFKNWTKYQESESTARTRKYRERRSDVTGTSQERHSDAKCDGDVTVEEEVEVEVEEEVDIDNISKAKPERHEYGSEKNVLLTDAQYQKFQTEMPQAALDACIDELSTSKAMKGYKYKRDDLAMRKWVIDKVKAAKPELFKPQKAAEKSQMDLAVEAMIKREYAERDNNART